MSERPRLHSKASRIPNRASFSSIKQAVKKEALEVPEVPLIPQHLNCSTSSTECSDQSLRYYSRSSTQENSPFWDARSEMLSPLSISKHGAFKSSSHSSSAVSSSRSSTGILSAGSSSAGTSLTSPPSAVDMNFSPIATHFAPKAPYASPTPSKYTKSPMFTPALAADESKVSVCVRVRPPRERQLGQRTNKDNESVWQIDGCELKCADFAAQACDTVVTSQDNADVYTAVGEHLIESAVYEGYSCAIIAYGQTATGKTYTLTGEPNNPGLVTRAIQDIFALINADTSREYSVRMSYVEVYNEAVRDLLRPEIGNLKVRMDGAKNFFLQPLKEQEIFSGMQASDIVDEGLANCITGKTDFNDRSSRSHTIIQFVIESWDPSDVSQIQVSRVHLVDLAGSETATMQGIRRTEGAKINKSLLTLEKVISALATDQEFVPFRESKLTQILQPCLRGNTRIAVIATINPSRAAIEDTKSTLKFAMRVRAVRVRAVVDRVRKGHVDVDAYEARIDALETELLNAAQEISRLESDLEYVRSALAKVQIDIVDERRCSDKAYEQLEREKYALEKQVLLLEEEKRDQALNMDASSGSRGVLRSAFDDHQSFPPGTRSFSATARAGSLTHLGVQGNY